MAKRLRQQIIKVKNYGYDWLNRLAVVCCQIEQMDPVERQAAFRFIKSKYSADWPSDTY